MPRNAQNRSLTTMDLEPIATPDQVPVLDAYYLFAYLVALAVIGIGGVLLRWVRERRQR